MSRIGRKPRSLRKRTILSHFTWSVPMSSVLTVSMRRSSFLISQVTWSPLLRTSVSVFWAKTGPAAIGLESVSVAGVFVLFTVLLLTMD